MTARTYQEAALESQFEKIARIMARKYGVTVVIRGAQAYVDLATSSIVLPSIGPGRDVQVEHLDGFLDHETAHVIHSDPKVFESIKDKTLHGLWNGVEDPWIEREMGKAYYGCHQNMERLNAWLYGVCEQRWPTMDALGRLSYALERCYRGDYEKERYADDPLMGAIILQLQPEIDRGRVCADSQEALAIAQSILSKIQDLAGGEGGASDDDADSVDDHAGSGGTAGAGSDFVDASGVEEEADGGASDSGDADAEGSQQSGEPAEVDGEEADDEADPEKENGGEEGEEAETEAGLTEAQQQAQDFLDQQQAGAFVRPLDVEALVNEELTKFFDWSTANDPEQYVVFSEEYDYDTTYDPSQRAALQKKYKSLCDEVHKYVGNLASILELTLTAEAEDRWVGGARRGKKFDQRKLSYWMEGADDDRLFRYLEQGVKHDTAVTMLWDCSGSMGNANSDRSKAYLARVAATAFHEALKRCKTVTHEVLGFNTGGTNSPELAKLIQEAQDRGEDLSRYSRLSERDARMVLVPFGSDAGWPIATITGAAANRDGECVLWAARRLAQRPEKRKILIVGSDGHPQGALYDKTEKEYLREVVLRVRDAGLEIFGLGIKSDAVSKYYPQYQVIQDIRALPRAVMMLLTSSLPAQQGRRYGARL